jgi:hypothetical protein
MSFLLQVSDHFCVVPLQLLKLPRSSPSKQQVNTKVNAEDNQAYGIQLPHETPNPNESSTEETKDE